ncbi:uncharacterized protein LOC118191089 [Stegodyphus dumicola]|uniref:uncharacterized protein LOC118191089 n=1 Tax=Stegodyphus dumicola TaxID=202533 RepID=UPI0015A8EA0A|nr:uncharacterized protein LOC118191089 [Stegodyphus dumicola]
MNVQDTHTVDHLKDLDVLYTLPLSQIPEFCKILNSAILSETAIALFLSAILNLEQQISLATAIALIHHIVYPKIVGMKNSRIILASILTFSEVYPKAVIDEVIIPSLKIESLENLQLEMLFKMSKNNIPDDCISYCIKNILEHAPAGENTFSVLQCLIERKMHHEQNFYDMLAWKIQSWALKYDSSIKFIKLLISILSVYGTELTSQHVLLYEDVIKYNKSIMKKAAENLVKKFKKA